MEKLLIIDGNHLMHRSFHAYPPFTDSNNNQIGAVYGFFAILIKVIELIKPTHLIICFDRPSPTFRKNMFANYQIKRTKMDDDLVSQMQIIHDALNQLNLPIFEIDGYEADDLIGTLAFQTEKEKDLETIIFSGDRDLLQLVNSKVKILAPITGVTKFILFDSQTVKEKFGINPNQIIDYKALVGDASDGYPGVAGVGPKTAVELLNRYETIEKIFENINLVPVKIAKKLADSAETCVLCKKLATIVLDAPIHMDLEKADLTNITENKLLEVFDKYGFNSLKNRIFFLKKQVNKTITAKPQILKKNENQMSLI